MELQICRVGEGYGLMLPKAILDDLAVGEGSLLKAESHGSVLTMTPVDPEFARQLDAFLRTEAEHEFSYRELAK